MNKTHPRGFTLIELTAVAGIISTLSAGTYLGVQKGRERECINNLKQIYDAVMMFEMDNGTLPGAKFFPSSASDSRGIHSILAQYGVRNVMFCPSLPAQLNNYGTNYIWNDTVNNRNINSIPSSTWLMTEMTAVSKNIPPPHMAGFSVLYVEGNAQVSPRIEFSEVKTPEPEPSKPELKKPDEPAIPTQSIKTTLNLVTKKEVRTGEEVKISIFMTDSTGKTITLKPGILSITYTPQEYAEMPETIEVKEESSRVNFNAVFQKTGKVIVKVRDENTGTEAMAEVNVSAGIFSSFSFPSFPVLWEAGNPQKVRIVLVDKMNNRVDYNGEAVLAFSAGETSLKKIIITNGVWEGELTLNKASEGNLLYAGLQDVVSVSPEFTVKHSSPASVEIISANEAVAGVPYEIVVRVKDAYGNLCVDYNGEFEISLPEGAVSDEKKILILPEDEGVKKNNLTFFKSGNIKIQILNNQVRGSKEIYVNPGYLNNFSIKDIGEQEAGKAFDIVVRAVDRWGNQVKGYYIKDNTGTITYVNRDNTGGVWMESIVITKSGEHMIYLEDIAGHQGRSNTFIVRPSAPCKMEIFGIPVSIRKSKEYTGSIIVKDKFDNILSDYKAEVLSEYPDDLKVSIFPSGKNLLQIKVTAEKTGYYKFIVRDKNNKDLSTEQVLFVTENN